jgi:RNA polymerase sigma-70 factor (ECF subfamily)
LAAPPDPLLLEGLARGDEVAFEALFLRYYAHVYGVLFRLLGDRQEAEDAAQEVFLKLHDQRFARQREHSLGGWLYRVAVNLALNRRRGDERRAKREATAASEEVTLHGSGEPDPADLALRNEERTQVRRALAELPERSRLCLLLRHAGLSYAEVAAALGVAPGSVGTLLARAEERFRERYRELSREEGRT